MLETVARGIVFSGLYQDQEYRNYDHRFKLNPDGDYKYFQKSYLASLSYTYVLGNSAFLDLIGSSFTTRYNQYVYEDPLDTRYVKPERMRDVGGNAFLTGGTQNWHFNHTTTTYTGKADFTWQVNNTHQVKTGFEYKYHDIGYKDFQIVIDATTNYKPSLPNSGSFNFNQYKSNPYQLSAYLQDKLNWIILVVNVGLRLDYFEPMTVIT